jgi:hypothetical protein
MRGILFESTTPVTVTNASGLPVSVKCAGILISMLKGCMWFDFEDGDCLEAACDGMFAEYLVFVRFHTNPYYDERVNNSNRIARWLP